jgi:hypothetical protein
MGSPCASGPWSRRSLARHASSGVLPSHCKPPIRECCRQATSLWLLSMCMERIIIHDQTMRYRRSITQTCAGARAAAGHCGRCHPLPQSGWLRQRSLNYHESRNQHKLMSALIYIVWNFADFGRPQGALGSSDTGHRNDDCRLPSKVHEGFRTRRVPDQRIGRKVNHVFSEKRDEAGVGRVAELIEQPPCVAGLVDSGAGFKGV